MRQTYHIMKHFRWLKRYFIEDAYLGAAANGHVSALEQLHQRGVPWDYAVGPHDAAIIACQRGHVQILELLRVNKVNILVSFQSDSNFLIAARCAQVRVMKYLAGIKPLSTKEKEQASKILPEWAKSSYINGAQAEKLGIGTITDIALGI